MLREYIATHIKESEAQWAKFIITSAVTHSSCLRNDRYNHKNSCHKHSHITLNGNKHNQRTCSNYAQISPLQTAHPLRVITVSGVN